MQANKESTKLFILYIYYEISINYSVCNIIDTNINFQRFKVMDVGCVLADREFREITRTCMLRFLSLIQSTPGLISMHNDLDAYFVRLLHNNYDLKEHIIKQICSLDSKNDNFYVGIIAYLEELIIWSKNWQSNSQQDSKNSVITQNTQQCIYTQAIKIVSNSKIHYSMNSKRCQLLGYLMKMPYCFRNIQKYQQVYQQFLNIREFYPVNTKQQQRKLFMRCIQDSLSEAGKYKYLHILQFLHKRICEEIYEQELTHQMFLSKLRIIKNVLINLDCYHQKILNMSAFLLIRYSDKVTENYGFATIAFTIYNQIMEQLIQKQSIVPLCLFSHLIINNIVKLQRHNDFMLLRELLLYQVSQIFQIRFLKYFLKFYDWNFMEEDVCLNCLKILYEYTQDHSNQNNPDYDLYKKCLTKIQKQIQNFVIKVLQPQENQEKRGYRKQMKQFYDLKAKEYKQIVEKINNKPKQIFKMLDAIQSQSAREDFIQKVLKILKKSRHIQPKSMINVLSAGTSNSDLMMDKYLQTFIQACKGKNLEEFVRLFTSNFFLWGEAQQIQRVIDKLTVFYCKNQSEGELVFKDSDVAYTFANAIIILNTDIHNPKNQNKITLQAFFKMCRKINKGQDLPEDMIKQIYHNIKHDEILTFRECSKMSRINLQNWEFIAKDTDSVPISYYDYDMSQLSQRQFYGYAYELLTNLIDQKQTAKLELMVQRFEYSQKKFDCQIVDKIRTLVPNKPHLAMHILQKVYDEARFQTRMIDDKLISYYWLAAQIITNFSEHLPYSKICEFLLLTWRIGFQLKDTLKMKEKAEFQIFKKMLKDYKKRQTKKSIMDMFSKFLSNKDSDQQEDASISPTIQFRKKVNYSNCSSDILQIIMKSNDSKTRAAQSILLSLKHQQSKRYEQFLSCLYLFFSLLEESQSGDSEQILLSFYEQILNFETCKLGERIQNLKNKSPEKHQILQSYCLYWALKLLLKTDKSSQISNKNFPRKKQILKFSSSIIKKCNKQTLKQFISSIKLNKEQGIKYLKQLEIYEELHKYIKYFEINSEFFQQQVPPVKNEDKPKIETSEEKKKIQNGVKENQKKIQNDSIQKKEEQTAEKYVNLKSLEGEKGSVNGLQNKDQNAQTGKETQKSEAIETQISRDDKIQQKQIQKNQPVNQQQENTGFPIYML